MISLVGKIKNNKLLSKYTFSQKLPQDKYSIKHNPNKQKQLEGYQQYQNLTNYDKTFLCHHHLKSKSYFSLYNIFHYLPLKFIQTISINPYPAQISSTCDNIQLPKILPNSIPIYTIQNSYNFFNNVFKTQILFVTGYILFCQMKPFYLLLMIFTYNSFYIPTYGKLISNMVIRADLIPQTQEIIFQKINYFNKLTNIKVSIYDLEHYNDLKISQVSQQIAKTMIDPKMIFKVKSTGQILYFRNNGIWYQSGFNHPLIN